MPDYTIGLKAEVPDAFQTIGNILAIKQAKTNLDTSRATQGATIRGANAAADTAQTGAESSRYKLTAEQSQAGRNMLQGLVSDPDVVNGNSDAIISKLSSTRQQMIDSGIPVSLAEASTARYIALAHDDPKAVRQLMLNSIQSGVGSTGQAANVQPSGPIVSSGQVSKQINTNPFATGVGEVIPGTETKQKITPGEQHTVQPPGPLGGPPTVINKDAEGNVTDISNAPVAGQPSPPRGPIFMPPGETPDTLKVVQGIRANANQTASTVPEQQFNTNQIIHYAENATTGTGAQFLNNLKGQFSGLPFTADSATNFNMLGHSIALQTGSLANSAGLNGTNSARSLAEESTSKTDWTKDAIVQSARTMRALSTGANLFNEGIENAVSSGNPFAARTFQNEWARVADVNAMRLYDAVKNKDADPEGLKATVQSMGGPKGATYQFSLKKIDAMKALLDGSKSAKW